MWVTPLSCTFKRSCSNLSHHALQKMTGPFFPHCLLHARVDPNTPVTETFLEMKALVDEGKVRPQ